MKFNEVTDLVAPDTLRKSQDHTFIMGCPGCGDIIIAASLVRRLSADPVNNAAFIVWMIGLYNTDLEAHQSLCVDDDTPNVWVWKPEQDGDEDDYQTM